MSDAVATALVQIARILDHLSPAERSWVVPQGCFSLLSRLDAEDRGRALRHLRLVFSTPMAGRLGHANSNGHGARPAGVQPPPDTGSPPGLNPVHEPGLNPVQTPAAELFREGGPGGGFPDFWSAYPLKHGKIPAEKKWNQLQVSGDTLRLILVAIEAQKQSSQWLRGMIPLPKTWLHQRRWLDELHGGSFIVNPSVNLDEPIPWNDPGALIQRWNSLAPGDDARGKGCTAVESVDAALLALEREALTWQPAETWWAETFAEMNASKRKLLARCPTTEGGLGVICTVDRFLSPGDGTRRRLAARVHDGELRDA